MFEFSDEDGVGRFFRMENQLKIVDNKTLKVVQSKLNSKISDEEEFYKSLQGQIDQNNVNANELRRSERH